MANQQRWRFTFAKGEGIKYISHLDLHTAWERAMRRADLPLAYSLGFNPQAKLQLAAALPVGYMGTSEIMDVFLTGPMTSAEVLDRLRPVLPTDLVLIGAEIVDSQQPSLQSALVEAVYKVEVETAIETTTIEDKIREFMDATVVEQPRLRKGRVETVNIRDLVLDLHLDAAGRSAPVTLEMRLKAGQRGNARPETVLQALGLPDTCFRATRTRLIFEFDTH